MEPSTWQKLEDLFAEAIALPPERRAAFCDRACGDDAVLRDELRSLVDAHDAEDNPLDRPVLSGRSGGGPPETLAEGTRIGVWRVGALIDIGGSGEVYFASRADGAYEQRVALKRLYRETAPDLARFLAERQILASLDHPGIARLVDGGVADDGRLYAVVEYVDGRSLVEHCRERRATHDERLALFLAVCDVVAYAHRNLIVHRDLKPGNILVTTDGRVKLLDFGVAKRLDGNAGAIVDGTVAPFTSDYAAPEQLTGAPITTATDVYALGVVLFELLTGERPWRSDGMPIARVVQQIVQGEPPTMSLTAGADAPVPAARLAGDLDAIVATCLRKESASRYPTVDALRRDIERHLANEPVAARGRARSYVLGRALRRYRWPVAAGAVVFASLATGLAATSFQAHRAEVERDTARRAASREEAIRDQIVRLFRTSIADKGDGPVTANAMLDRSAKRVLTEYRDDPRLVGKVVVTLADLYGALEDTKGQSALLESYVAAAGPDTDVESLALARQKLAMVDVMNGRIQDAAALLTQAEGVWAGSPDRYREQRLEAMQARGSILRSQGDLDGSIAVYRSAIAERIAYSGAVHRETASLYNSLAITLTNANRLGEALDAYHAALDIYAKLGLGDTLEAAVILGNTGTLTLRVGRLREGAEVLKNAFEQQRQRGGDSATVAGSMGLYGGALTALGRPDDAVDVLRPALDIATRYAGPGSALEVIDRIYLTDALAAAGRRRDARDVAAQNLAVTHERFGDASTLTLRARVANARIDLDDGHAAAAYVEFANAADRLRRNGPLAQPSLAYALMACGDALLAEDRAADAAAPLREAVAIRERIQEPTGWELAVARMRLGEALKRSRQPEGQALLQQGAEALAAQVGPNHPDLQRARRVMAQPV